MQEAARGSEMKTAIICLSIVAIISIVIAAFEGFALVNLVKVNQSLQDRIEQLEHPVLTEKEYNKLFPDSVVPYSVYKSYEMLRNMD